MLLLRLALDRVVGGKVEDSSGHHWSMTSRGLKVGADPERRFESCVSFDGERSIIRVEGIRCPPAFTLATWVRKSRYITYFFATIAAFGEDSPYIGLHRGRPMLGTALSLPDELSTSWTHLAVVQDRQSSRMFIDGELAGSSTNHASTVGRGLGIGCDLTRGRSFFQGEMAHLALFDEALAQESIQDMMRDGHQEPRKVPVPPREARWSSAPPRSSDHPGDDATPLEIPPVVGHTMPSRAVPRPELARLDLPRLAAPRIEVPRLEPARIEAPRIEVPRLEAPRVEVPHLPVPRIEAPRPRPEPPRPQAHREKWSAPASRSPLYAGHVAILRKMHGAFPAAAFGETIAALEAGAEPLARSIALSGTFTLAEGGSLQAEVGPFSLGAGGVNVVELSGAGDGRAAELCVDMAPPGRDATAKVTARLRGRLSLFGGALVKDIDEELSAEGGVTISLSNGEVVRPVEATVGLRSWKRCAVSLRTTFSHSVGVRGHELDLPLVAAIRATLDGDVLRQHLAYSLDLAGEEIRVVVPHDAPLRGVFELLEIFESAGRRELEERVSDGIVRRGSAALKWLGQKHLETVERDLQDAAARLFHR